MSVLKRIVISCGDPYGIGPEVALKAMQALESQLDKKAALIIFLPDTINEYYVDYGAFKQITHPKDAVIAGNYFITMNTEVCPAFNRHLIGNAHANGGRIAKAAIDASIDACMNGDADAMCTAPIAKYAMQLAKLPIFGHTEYLAMRTNSTHVIMLLASKNLRVALQSIHIPISEVPNMVNKDSVFSMLVNLNRELYLRLKIEKPRIAVLGLNPHAGEEGHIGREEIEHIRPAIEAAQKEGIQAEGCFAADGFFGSGHCKAFDAVLAMYHDQGLAPFKSLSFGGGVNISLGLPFLRTSPDHGTAYALAGKQQAKADSMIEAIQTAIQYA